MKNQHFLFVIGLLVLLNCNNFSSWQVNDQSGPVNNKEQGSDPRMLTPVQQTEETEQSEEMMLKESDQIIDNKVNPKKNNFFYSPIDTNKIFYQREITRLEKEIADTKRDYYDSLLETFNIYLAIFGLILLIGTFLGFRNINNRLQEYINDYRREIDQTVKRVDEIKSDFKDFKIEAKSAIEEGMGTEIQDAIEKVIKNTYGTEIENIKEQISQLQTDLNVVDSEFKTEKRIQEEIKKLKAEEYINETIQNEIDKVIKSIRDAKDREYDKPEDENHKGTKVDEKLNTKNEQNLQDKDTKRNENPENGDEKK